MYVFSHVWLFTTRWTVARQAPLSVEFSRQEYWSGLPCLLQGIFLTQGPDLHLVSPSFGRQESCPTPCDPTDCSTPASSVLHYFLGFAQTHVHWVGDAFQPSHLLSSPSPPVFNLSQHQGLFQRVSSSHQVAKVLELQFQHQFFAWGLNVCFFW